MRGMVETVRTRRRRMRGNIRFGGVLNDQQGGLRCDPREGGVLMRGANRLRSEGWGGEVARGGCGRRPGAARHRDVRNWLRDQHVSGSGTQIDKTLMGNGKVCRGVHSREQHNGKEPGERIVAMVHKRTMHLCIPAPFLSPQELSKERTGMNRYRVAEVLLILALWFTSASFIPLYLVLFSLILRS